MGELDIRLKKFVQVLPSLPARDDAGNIIPDVYTEKKTLWGWFFDRENYWTITETQAQLVALENKIIENIDWKETVATFADIARTYPNPKEGWTVSVSDTNTIYRYDVASATWIKIFESSTELASATRNGLMSIANFNKLAGIEDGANRYIHPTNHPASIITTDASNRFVSDALINKWNALVTFPGFAGVGGDYGTSTSAARHDHNHSTLTGITKLNFAAASSDTAWIGINIPSGEETHLDFYLADNPEQDTFRWRFGESGGSGIVQTLMELKTSGLFFKGNLVSFAGHRHAMSDIDGLSLDWVAIVNKPATATRWPSWDEVTGKPSTFTPAAHTHAMSDISGLSLDWVAIVNKPATATRWPSWDEVTGKPSTFTPAVHNHDGSYVASAIRTTWKNTSVISNVVGQLAWRNYGNGHTIFDASAGLTPDGTSCDKKNSSSKWNQNYPTLMGWNGSETHGVRVDSSRASDESNYATYGGRLISLGYGLNTYDVVSRFNVKNDGRFRLQIEGSEDAKNYVDKVSVGHADYANSAGSAPASDVYGWAKAATKPAYSWGEISDKPTVFTFNGGTNSGISGATDWEKKLPVTDGYYAGHEQNIGDISLLNLKYSQILMFNNRMRFRSKHFSNPTLDTDFVEVFTTNYLPNWSQIQGKPATAERWPSWDEVTGKPNVSIESGTWIPTVLINIGATRRHGWKYAEAECGIATANNESYIYTDGWFYQNGGQYRVIDESGGTFTGYVDFTGGAGNSGSDMRFKNVLSKSIQPVLNSLRKLQIFDYVWNKKDEQARNTFGVNADQLIKFGGSFKKIVHERDDEEKTQWVEYERLGLLAIKGIQELCEQQEIQLKEQSEENKKLRKAIDIICQKLNIEVKDLGL